MSDPIQRTTESHQRSDQPKAKILSFWMMPIVCEPEAKLDMGNDPEGGFNVLHSIVDALRGFLAERALTDSPLLHPTERHQDQVLTNTPHPTEPNLPAKLWQARSQARHAAPRQAPMYKRVAFEGRRHGRAVPLAGGGDRLSALVSRFQFSPEDLTDKRISGLLQKKAKLDEEITPLLASGAREARVARTAKFLAFSPFELDHSRAIGNLIKSIIESSACIQTWKPKESNPKPNHENVERTECLTKPQ